MTWLRQPSAQVALSHSVPGRTFYGGYVGFFTDPDGHAWEIAYNPGFPLAADGSITIPDLSATSYEFSGAS